MKWVYSEGVLTDVDSDHRMGKGLKLYLYLNTWAFKILRDPDPQVLIVKLRMKWKK
jgi:hypothetical protein